MKKLPDTDMHFGPDEDMLEWCHSVGITPHKDELGEWDWQRAWDEYCAGTENGDTVAES